MEGGGTKVIVFQCGRQFWAFHGYLERKLRVLILEEDEGESEGEISEKVELWNKIQMLIKKAQFPLKTKMLLY